MLSIFCDCIRCYRQANIVTNKLNDRGHTNGQKQKQNQETLTFDMRECAKHTTRTIASLLYIIAFGWFVDFWMKLLFGTCVTILTIITGLTIGWFAPFFAVLDIRTRCRPIFEFPRTPSFVFAIVILRTSIALPAQTRRTLARLSFVIGQHIIGVLPLWVFIH